MYSREWAVSLAYPSGRRGIISSFKWFLPAVATCRGGGRSAPCGLDGETEDECEDRKGRGYERSLTTLKNDVPDQILNESVFHLLLNFWTNSTTLSRLTIRARDIRRGQGQDLRHSGTRHLQCKTIDVNSINTATALNSNFSEALYPILYYFLYRKPDGSSHISYHEILSSEFNLPN